MENTFGMEIIPENDVERIKILKRYQIAGTPSEGAFDNVAMLAAQIFGVSIALVSLVDAEKVFFKANVGMGNVKSSPRGNSLCSLAILQPTVTVFENAPEEPCLLSNPLVAGDFGLKFYAGAPLITHDGFSIGTLCVIDKKTRNFTEQDRTILQGLAKIVMDEIELRLSAKLEMEKQLLSNRTIEKVAQQLNNMVMSAPMGMTILKGRSLIVETANQQMLHIWNRTYPEVLNKSLLDIFPELIGQPFPKMLEQVFNTGETIALPEIEADISTAAGNKHIYVDFQYAPLFDLEGKVESVMATVIDITTTVLSRKLLETSEREQQMLNEELSATVEELAAANEEMLTTNEELALTYQELKELSAVFEESESRFRNMIELAPVAMLVLRGEAMVFEIINSFMLKLLDRGPDIIGKTMLSGMPEIAGQPIFDIIYEVYRSGKPYYGFETPVILQRNHKEETAYFNFAYTPLLEHGKIVGILQVATEVTEQIRIRKDLQKAEEMLRFSIESANVGTWFIDIPTLEFTPSSSMKKLFGYHPDENMPYDAVLAQIDGEYRRKVVMAVDATFNKGENFNLEFPAIGFHDLQTRWLRAVGKLDYDQYSNLLHFSGVCIDITEQKQDEIRKNDFIAMVSHELKTPLTSLKGYMQLLTLKNRKNEDGFTLAALEKGNAQINKMTALINGFLNVSKLEGGKIHLDKQPFLLRDLVEEIVEEITMTTENHHIEVAAFPPVSVTADQEKIGQVINNFLSNAVKYSPKGKNITIACDKTANHVQLSIKDEGMGINEYDIDKLFDRFYRVNNKHAQNISGFGIGLYLCAEIIQRHNGKIWVESEIGKGSTFYFSLPVV